MNLVGQSEVASLINERSISLGLTIDGIIQWRQLSEFFEDQQHGVLLTQKYLPGMGHANLGKVLSGKAVLRNPVSTIALLLAFCGSWIAVETALANQIEKEVIPKSAFNFPDASSFKKSKKLFPSGNKKNPAKVQATYEKFVAAYRALRIRFPNYTHTDLLRRLPNRACVLTRLRLEKNGEDIPPTPSGKAYYAKLDESLARHIRQSHIILREVDHDARLSKNILLMGHSMVSRWRKFEHHLVQAKLALAQCEESHADFRRRCLRKCAEEDKVFSISPDRYADIDALDDETVLRLLRNARSR